MFGRKWVPSNRGITPKFDWRDCEKIIKNSKNSWCLDQGLNLLPPEYKSITMLTYQLYRQFYCISHKPQKQCKNTTKHVVKRGKQDDLNNDALNSVLYKPQ